MSLVLIWYYFVHLKMLIFLVHDHGMSFHFLCILFKFFNQSLNYHIFVSYVTTGNSIHCTFEISAIEYV